ncbi:hypothetical protein M2271_008245 [Streptomyces sp. LBL]|nr:hypothetical protein [Streptomyces sp. LBL]
MGCQVTQVTASHRCAQGLTGALIGRAPVVMTAPRIAAGPRPGKT